MRTPDPWRPAVTAAVVVVLVLLGRIVARPGGFPGETIPGANGALRIDPLRIDVNQDPWRRIALLPGIGEVRARAIVRYRNSHGPFSTLRDLEEVPGIGPATVARIRDLARAERSSPAPSLDSERHRHGDN